MSYTDVAETKRRAEAGDPDAQLSLANTFASNFRPADAIEWYRKAAAQGSIEAAYRMGTILLSGAVGIPAEKSVKPNNVTGIELIFMTATNRYKAAYYDMYRAHRDGIGVSKDIVQAYAWLQLDVDSASGFLTAASHQAELNRMALDLDVATSQAGKQFAALYKAGHWPTLTVVPPPAAAPSPAPVPAAKYALSTPLPPKPDPGLKVNGITYGKVPVVIINGKSLAEGDTVTIPLKPKALAVKCLKIETNSVLVSVEGEELPRRLSRH
jgi:TPR repeat protein